MLKVNCRRKSCPGVGISGESCAQCGLEMTIGGLYRYAKIWSAGFLRKQSKKTTVYQKWFQWLYAILSAAISWWLLGLLEVKFESRWIWHALLSTLYIGVVLFVIRVTIADLFIEADQASRLVKLGFFFNYLSALFLLQMFIGTWWQRSLMLGVLFVVTWAGCRIFVQLLAPTADKVSDALVGPRRRHAATLDTQGRTVRMD